MAHQKNSKIIQRNKRVFCSFQRLLERRKNHEKATTVFIYRNWIKRCNPLPPHIYGQSEKSNNDIPSGKIVRSYRENQSSESLQTQRPDWVGKAMRLSLAKIQHQQATKAFHNAEESFALQSAEQDDLGQTHLRLNQVKNQIPVFGGQLTTHIDTQDKIRIFGRAFEEAENIEILPLIDTTEAITQAKIALGYIGNFEKTSEAQLVILPEWIIDQQKNTSKVTLAYLVELSVQETNNPARHFYFINARNGDVLWHYNNLQTQVGTGTGNSLYSGTVNFKTYHLFALYYLQDNTKCPGCNPTPGPNPSFTMSMNNQINPNNGQFFANPTNIFGNGTTSNPESVGADAHFGMSKTWDYFYNVHGRYGIDGNGFQLKVRVHYDVNYNNAFWDGIAVHFGDGNGVLASPLVSVDTVAHEITHGLTEKTAGLIYANESGGANEAFSDIFGTAVEFYAGINPDYTIGEDWFTPPTPNDALRYMYNPPLDGGSIAHYSQYVPGMDVHYSSGIQNKAFYLLAADRGRNVAEKIFYRALTVYLTPGATFSNVRNATLNAATDLYGGKSKQYIATEDAWQTVGVF